MEISTFKFPSFLCESLLRKYFSSTRPCSVNILQFILLHFNIFTLFWISWPHGRSWPGTTFSPSNQAARAMFSPLTKPILASPPLFHKHSNPLLHLQSKCFLLLCNSICRELSLNSSKAKTIFSSSVFNVFFLLNICLKGLYQKLKWKMGFNKSEFPWNFSILLSFCSG